MTVRVSELPVVTTLNDDDFIIVNTQNIVTQGIETEFFIESLFGRDLEFTGTPIFSGGATFNGDLTVNFETELNNNLTVNGDLTLNGTTNLKIGELSDVDTTGAVSSSLLSFNAGSKTWVTIPSNTLVGKPAGNTKTIQYNNAGAFAGATNLIVDVTSEGSSGLIVKGSNGDIELSNTLTGGTIHGTTQLKIDSNNVIEIKAPSVKLFEGNVERITLGGSAVRITGATTVTGDLTVTGELKAGGLTYPTTDGSSGQVLATDGAGNIVFQTNSASPGVSIPFQPSPPLGSNAGELWMNSNTYKLYVWDGSWIATS